MATQITPNKPAARKPAAPVVAAPKKGAAPVKPAVQAPSKPAANVKAAAIVAKPAAAPVQPKRPGGVIVASKPAAPVAPVASKPAADETPGLKAALAKLQGELSAANAKLSKLASKPAKPELAITPRTAIVDGIEIDPSDWRAAYHGQTIPVARFGFGDAPKGARTPIELPFGNATVAQGLLAMPRDCEPDGSGSGARSVGEISLWLNRNESGEFVGVPYHFTIDEIAMIWGELPRTRSNVVTGRLPSQGCRLSSFLASPRKAGQSGLSYIVRHCPTCLINNRTVRMPPRTPCQPRTLTPLAPPTRQARPDAAQAPQSALSIAAHTFGTTAERALPLAL